MDRAGEEQRQQGERGAGDYYEPIRQVGGGSVAGGGGSRQVHMQYSEQMGQGEQSMEVVPMHLSELIPTHPHHLSQDKEARAEGRTQQQCGSEHQTQPQRSSNLPKDLGATQVRPDTEESHPNLMAGERDREGEQYGTRVPQKPKEGSVRPQEEGEGDQRGYNSSEESTKDEPGNIGLATHRDADGPHLYEMEGVGQREPGREPLAHRVYSPAPTPPGDQGSACTQHGSGDIGIAAHRDVDGPHVYEMEGVGRREEGRARFLKRHEGAAKDAGDVKGQLRAELSNNELGELDLDNDKC
ncbi:hypothetical protein EV426DRAFT_702374 [Tirmania nivea]|nr:hypothetical protein EV426DRAFT_702374 [Tirmania nivea]